MFRLFPLSAIFGLSLLVACHSGEENGTTAEADLPFTPYHSIPNATYVGIQNCQACHEQEYQDWKESDHHKAMNPATEEFVLGDFDDAEFDHFGQTFRFFRKGDEYWVNAQDENGDYQDMKIAYTFGHDPLQQYLIPFDGGKYQALQVCWDTRPAEEGGQRWYHLYPDEEVPHDDVLHWTRRHFNWNFMCADCHSTNLRKNFDSETLTYHTEWTDMNVTCEACHGPGSEHVKWAHAHEQVAAGSANAADFSEIKDYVQSKGLVVTLKDPQEVQWPINPETNLPERSHPLASPVEVETCARCHSHRQLNEPAYQAGETFHDGFHPSVTTEALYHHDGQIDEEVYVYGSYVQSAMFHAGVRCSDCHNPHSMKLKLPGNALCLQCHQGEYNTPAHHFHPMDSTGASCVECHMPETTYMGVDARRDHSLRIPRPDLAAKTGSPDACTQCHEKETQKWAAEHFKEWWGGKMRNAHYGEILAAARSGLPGSGTRLMALAKDGDSPSIIRAAAIETLGHQAPDPGAYDSIVASLQDKAPEVRAQGLIALARYPADQRTIALPLLDDPIRTVRIEAARTAAPLAERLDETQRAAFDRALAEFFKRQEANSDRAAGHANRALIYSDMGQAEKAKAAYRDAIRVEPEAIPSRINLAEILVRENQLEQAEAEFRAAVEHAALPEIEGVARDALARFLVRQKRYDEALQELKQATELAPNHAQTHYFYGIALNSFGKFEEALPALQRAHELEPYQLEFLTALATVCRDAKKIDLARKYAEKAVRIQPNNPQLQNLLRSLQGN